MCVCVCVGRLVLLPQSLECCRLSRRFDVLCVCTLTISGLDVAYRVSSFSQGRYSNGDIFVVTPRQDFGDKWAFLVYLPILHSRKYMVPFLVNLIYCSRQKCPIFFREFRTKLCLFERKMAGPLDGAASSSAVYCTITAMAKDDREISSRN